MKNIKSLSAAVLLISMHTVLSAAPKPSPYIVHDTEIYFFDIYSKVMSQPAPYRFAAQGILTPYQYVADLFFDVSVFDFKKSEKYISVFGGYAIQFHGNGNPDNTIYKVPEGYAPNNNMSAIHLLGGSYNSENLTVRLGYIFGSISLDDRVWDETQNKYISSATYFNYPSSDYTRSRGYERLYGNPSKTYQRMLFEIEWDYSFLILHLLAATDFTSSPSLSRIAPEFVVKEDTYHLTPYLLMTNDAEGAEGAKKFGITQGGFTQTWYFQYSRNDPMKQFFLRSDANYTHSETTAVAPGKKNLYGYLECNYHSILISTWLSQESGSGAGLGWVLEADAIGRIWIEFKYNPYVSTPVYARDINEGGWSFDLGFIVRIK